MPPNTTSGPSPYEVAIVRWPGKIGVAICFLPEHFTQTGDHCTGRFQVRLILRRGSIPVYQTEKRITLFSTTTAVPIESNLSNWLIALEETNTLHWELECWDLEQQHFFYQEGRLLAGAYAPLFLSRNQTLYRLYSILEESWIITSPSLLPLEAVLYQAESNVGVTRYLSIQEEALRGHLPPPSHLDTLALSWKRKQLKAGQYLAGFYFYRGGSAEKETFWPLWVSPS